MSVTTYSIKKALRFCVRIAWHRVPVPFFVDPYVTYVAKPARSASPLTTVHPQGEQHRPANYLICASQSTH
jgi:hypothetical protein